MRTVLIVDDEFASRDCLRQLLEQDGRAVITAADRYQALALLRTIPLPRLIVLDLAMPRMNGWEFLTNKNEDPVIAGVPTIVLSGTLTELPAGAMDHLTKPVDLGRLRALVDQYC